MELLKVLLVDDDMLSIAYMKENFDWNSYGFEVVGSAYNGKQALRQFVSLSPDLIISDISMPLMDGVSMAHEIRAMGRNTRIVLLTAYNEFEYVRSAIKADVDDYLIKDELSEPVLRECLGKVRARIMRDHQADDRAYQHALCDYINSGADYVKRHYPEEAIVRYMAAEHYFWILIGGTPLIRADAQSREAESPSSDMILSAFLENRELKSAAARVFWVEDCAVIAWDAEDTVGLEAELGRIATAYLDRLHSAQGCFSLLYSEHRISLERVRGLVRQKGHPIRCMRMLVGPGIARPLSAIPRVKMSMSAVELSDAVDRLLGCDDASAVERALRGLIVDPDGCCMAFERSVELLRSIDGRLRRSLAESDVQGEAPCDLRACAACFHASIQKLKRDKLMRPEVRKALDYLNSHYGDPELRLRQVARYVGLSDSRFSVVFKEDTGRTMGQYLTDIRISRAKQLLTEGKLRIYEIASMVGCRNSQYFSTLFYKETGMYPTAISTSITCSMVMMVTPRLLMLRMNSTASLRSASVSPAMVSSSSSSGSVASARAISTRFF